MKDIIIIGFGGHGKSLVDSIEATGKYNIIGYTDKQDNFVDYKYLGNDDILNDISKFSDVKLALGIGYMGKSNLREKIFEHFTNIGYSFPCIIDPTANISKTAKIEDGTFIGKGVIINSEAQIGKCCIINSGAIVEHECTINDFSHVAVGAILCGRVNVGKAAFIGAGATVIQCMEIPDYQIVPAGVVVR